MTLHISRNDLLKEHNDLTKIYERECLNIGSEDTRENFIAGQIVMIESLLFDYFGNTVRYKYRR